MSKSENNKITIEYKGKKYEVEKSKDEQKVKPKDGKDTDKEITVKNYEKGSWNHTCECSENGTSFDKVKVKWGKGKHFTIWGGLSVVAISVVVGLWLFLKNKKVSEVKEETL